MNTGHHWMSPNFAPCLLQCKFTFSAGRQADKLKHSKHGNVNTELSFFAVKYLSFMDGYSCLFTTHKPEDLLHLEVNANITITL
jgi:hypothetical protein